jgi:hypothetical protein
VPLYRADSLTIVGEGEPLFCVRLDDGSDHYSVDRSPMRAGAFNQRIDICPTFSVEEQTNGVWFMGKRVASTVLTTGA